MSVSAVSPSVAVSLSVSLGAETKKSATARPHAKCPTELNSGSKAMFSSTGLGKGGERG